MAGSVRKSEFLWNTQEDTLPPVEMSGKNLWPGKECHSSFRRGSSPKWSNSEASNELKSGDFSRRPSREHLQMKSDVPKDDDISRDRRRMHTDPALDGWDHPYNGHPSDDSFSLPHRGRGKGNIRSTSRDRDQSRSRSRSWSPNQSRDKDRDRDRDMGRSRSRSRDRGRGGGSARGRSRSPFGDDRRESYEYINSRSGPRISSQPCRNFTAGNCRRGNLCKFFHQEHLNSRGGSRSENDVTERWNSRPDNSGASRYGNDRNSVDRSRNKVSDGYKRHSGADEQARDTSKDTSLCKDFQYGRCQRGALCRYPHHVASGDNYKRGNRNVYDDQDRKSQPNRSGKVPCKYFASGRCSRDDCKFSHDGPTSGGFDGRSRNNSLGHNLDDKNKAWNGPSWDEGDASGFSDIAKSNRSFDDKNKSRNGGPSWDDSSASGVSDVAKSKHNMDDKNKSWNGPSWDDSSAQGFSDIVKSNDKLDGRNKLWNDPSWDDSNASGLSDIAKSTAWDGGSVGNLKFRDSAGPEKQSNSKSGQWDGPGWNEKASERNDNLSVTNDAYMATNELGVADKQEPKLIPDGSQSQTLDEISLHPHQQHIIPKDSGCHTTVTRPEVSEISYVQQCRKQGGDNFAMIDDSNPLDVDMVSENADTEVLNLGKGFILSGHNMGSHYPSSLGGNHIFSLNPANGPKIELNGSVEGTLLPLHSLRQTKRHHKEAGEPLEKLEMKVPLVMPVMNETVVSREQVAQLSSLPPSLTQISQTGQLPQAYAELNLANVMGLVYSLPTCASSVLPIDPTFAQSNPDNRSKEQYDIARDIEASKPSNNGVPMEFLSSSTGQVSQMQLEPLSPISTVDPNSSKLQTSGISEEGYKKSPKIKQEEPVNPEINENSIAEKHKHGQENIHPGGSDAQAKLEEGNISNDEKAMRQFKIALVEFVKEILKPTWKEGQMSREVHKTIVKKVVDKVSSTIQGIQIPRTQEKIDQYLAFSKSKITKLVEAYVERFLKG